LENAPATEDTEITERIKLAESQVMNRVFNLD